MRLLTKIRNGFKELCEILWLVFTTPPFYAQIACQYPRAPEFRKPLAEIKRFDREHVKITVGQIICIMRCNEHRHMNGLLTSPPRLFVWHYNREEHQHAMLSISFNALETLRPDLYNALEAPMMEVRDHPERFASRETEGEQKAPTTFMGIELVEAGGSVAR